MSSDDTDVEGTFYAGKVVRRVRKFWISSEVTKVSLGFMAFHCLTQLHIQILHVIDSNYNPRTLSGSRKRGSGPLKRELASLRCNALHSPLPHLPINFYNPELGEEKIQTLGPLPSMKFPELQVLLLFLLVELWDRHIC